MTKKISEQSASRYTLTQEWQELQKRVDWMNIPTMADYVNGIVSGKDLSADGHWAIYARDIYLYNLQETMGKPLSMVSIACGNGHIEEALLTQFNWPVVHFLGLEFDAELRKSAAEKFNKIRGCSSEFSFFDFNDDKLEIKEQFDIVFVCHSLHHATEIEKTLEKINLLLKPNGLFIGIDYFGPTRFQIEHDVLPIIQELFSYLPKDLRHNIKTKDMIVDEIFSTSTISEVRNADISEAIRSSDLRTLLFSNFPIIEIKPMGGTILRWLLQYRAGNFKWDNPYHISIIHFLQFIEREFIRLNRIKSDDLFFVLSKSDRF